MVLPASAPDAQPGAAVAPWAERVAKILRLVEGGILVLVDGADDAQLGVLVRGLAVDHGGVEVLTEAPRVEDAPQGAVVVLATRPEDAEWLNMARPIFADRALRVVLWSKATTTAALATRAPDFFDWIARLVECLAGPPRHAIAGLRAALRARAWGVIWRGSALDEAFGAALPGRAIVRASAAMPYSGLIAAARSAGRAWLVWQNVDGERDLRRLRWALAETGRRGRNILENPRAEAIGAWPVHAATEDLGAAVRRLEAAGAPSPGRLAALLDLEPEAVTLASELLAGGVPQAEIEAAILGAADPGAALALLSRADIDPQRVAVFGAPPPVLRAFSMDPRVREARAEQRAAEEVVAASWLARFDHAAGEVSEAVDAFVAAILRACPTSRAAWAALASVARRVGERDVAVWWGARGIDFSALQRLDEEAEALTHEGRWTREAFARLWQDALGETGGDESWLDFLRYPARPEWLPDRPRSRARGVGVEPVARRVAELIRELDRGWTPRLVLSRSEAVYWNGEILPSANADVALEGSAARVSMTCEPRDAERLENAIKTCGGVRNTLRTEHAGDWCLDGARAAVVSLRTVSALGNERRSRVEVRTHWWSTRRRHAVPLLWVAPLTKPIDVLRGNLLVIVNPPFVPHLGYSSGGGWSRGHWRLRGEYTYFIVEIGEQAAKRQYMIIETRDGEELDRQILHRDMLALQFIWGVPLQAPLLYGLRGTEIVASMGTSYDKGTRGAAAPAISAHLGDFEYSIEPFFSKLSRALRAETTARLAVPVEGSLWARRNVIDDAARDLTAALTSFAHWTLRGTADAAGPVRKTDAWEAWIERHAAELRAMTEPALVGELLENLKAAADWTPLQRLWRALAQLGIRLPREVSDEIALYERRLRTIGTLTEGIGRSDDEHEREVHLVDTLRTLLVAMVAASVGYRGVIRGIRHDEGPPAWWRVDPLEEKQAHQVYVAVMAPAPLILPRLAPGVVLLLVEQRHHATIVEEILRAASIPVERIHILAGGGRRGLRELVQATESAPATIVAGSRRRNVQGAVEELRRELAVAANQTVLCAVPDVDAWLLADDALLRRQAGQDPELLAEIDAMALPDEVADPFEQAHRLLGPPERWSVVRGVDIHRACSRSPSLRHFLDWMARALGVDLDLPRASSASAPPSP